ncbi:hypothetical protein ACKUB1_17910 [Methanospirillum stamsii]|uniref:Uncharacterized protein n=1 Tax=Methanospirillum stamsii TaxID=1277351 RepID=A0A2V2NA63_9EURY|nr:hypothetical protein [Methanospirillum stamsii]PWR73368.1 hypothetical protein DLD82_10910 [Methanospirillum stamsii]
MSESITVSSENKQFLDLLKKPGESYDDVLEALLEDYKIDYSGWSERAEQALAEHRRGESISFEAIKKKYGVE